MTAFCGRPILTFSCSDALILVPPTSSDPDRDDRPTSYLRRPDREINRTVLRHPRRRRELRDAPNFRAVCLL